MTPVPGSPGSVRDRETRWALYAATYRRKRGMYGVPTADRKPGVLLTQNGRTVVLANPRKPYGRSTHGRATLTHLVREVLLAYRSGQLAGALATWWCGSHTPHFRLDDEAPGPLCLVCQVNAIREANTR